MQTSSLRRKYAADFEQDKRFAPIITRAPPIDRQLTKGVRNGRNPCKYKGFDQTVNFFAPLLTHRDDLGRFVTRGQCAHSHPRDGIDPIISSHSQALEL